MGGRTERILIAAVSAVHVDSALAIIYYATTNPISITIS